MEMSASTQEIDTTGSLLMKTIRADLFMEFNFLLCLSNDISVSGVVQLVDRFKKYYTPNQHSIDTFADSFTGSFTNQLHY